MQVFKRKKRVSVKEAVQILGISEYELRKRIKEKKCPYIKVGVKYLIDIVAMESVLRREAYGNLSEDYYDSEDNIIHFSGVQAIN